MPRGAPPSWPPGPPPPMPPPPGPPPPPPTAPYLAAPAPDNRDRNVRPGDRDRRDRNVRDSLGGGHGGPGGWSEPRAGGDWERGRGRDGGAPPDEELPKDIDGGLIWVSRREGVDEAYAKKLIGMASDGGIVFEKWITSPNTVIFLCDVSKNNDGHQILLDMFRAQPREGAGERRMYREALGDQPLDPTAFLDNKPDGLPHQVKLVPWQMGLRPGKIGTIQRGRNSILRDTNFRDWLSSDLRKKIRTDGGDEFPVILTKEMAEELALGLIKEGREQDKRKSRQSGNGGYK